MLDQRWAVDTQKSVFGGGGGLANAVISHLGGGKMPGRLDSPAGRAQWAAMTAFNAELALYDLQYSVRTVASYERASAACEEYIYTFPISFSNRPSSLSSSPRPLPL
jgi:hypothetical protein